jgi:hypothetical protein
MEQIFKLKIKYINVLFIIQIFYTQIVYYYG